jgi:hypothetical protein
MQGTLSPVGGTGRAQQKPTEYWNPMKKCLLSTYHPSLMVQLSSIPRGPIVAVGWIVGQFGFCDQHQLVHHSFIHWKPIHSFIHSAAPK